MKDYDQIVHRVLRRATTSFLVVITFISMIGAQDVTLKSKQIDEPLPLSEQAKTIPISNNQITLKITLDGGQSVLATQYEGGMIRLEMEGGEIFGLTPYKRGLGDAVVNLKIFRIIRIKKGGKVVGEGITELETSVIGNQPSRTLSSLANNEPRFSVQLVGIKEYSKIKEIGLRPQYEAAGTCCVTCDGMKTCACSVETTCGSCCIGVCCN
ncbi:MAG: hypothetical protein AABN34_16470 [Acidobacteriota bacterium]